MERFTKVRNIGKGNMGACTLARNNEDGRYYVIKQVDLAKLSKKERQQSLNEAKVLSSLRHPNIINYVDSFLARKSDHLCIVMEYADSGDLSQRVKASHGVNFSQDQILDWSIQIALSLQHIHSKKILHRDVKTQNVFLTSEGLCKLGDFGIARFLNNTFDQANTFVGTPYYLSPELILERPYDAMSDVWAFGVCLYEVMALRHPFNANDMKALMQRILKVQYDPPPTCYTEPLRQIVSRLLVKDPQQRMKLSEFLEEPIMLQRMSQWLAGGIMPSRYVASLVRHKLLPASIQPAVAPGPSKELPAIPQSMAQGRRQAQDMDIRVEDNVPALDPQQQQQQQRQHRKDEIAAEYRDLRGMRPRANNGAPNNGAAAAAGGPMGGPRDADMMQPRMPPSLPAVGPPAQQRYPPEYSAFPSQAAAAQPMPRAQPPPSLAPLAGARPLQPLAAPPPRQGLAADPGVVPVSRNLPPVGRIPMPPLAPLNGAAAPPRW